jgi:hypothetical protein
MSTLELEVFRAGDYGAKGAFDEHALENIAADYDAALHEAPVTLDHAQSGPAHGWVAGLRRAGDKLVATLRGLSAPLRELLTAGAFKKRSVELYPQFKDTGRPYLRAVSFLGAAVPEVKGLSDAPLADPLAGSLAEPPPVAQDSTAPQPTPLFADDAPWCAIDDAGAPAAPSPAQSFTEFAEKLRATGHWQPAWETRGIAAFHAALAPQAAAWFAEFLAALPPAITFGALAEPQPTSAASNALHFTEAAPGGPAVTPRSMQLHRAALALQQSEPRLNYTDALLRVAR